MRSLYKISLAILAAGFLAVAGSAYAQDMAKPTFTITGNAGAAFSYNSFDKTTQVAGSAANTKGFSEFGTQWESNVRFTWTTDSFTSIVRYRIRAAQEGAGSISNSSANDIQSGSAYFSSSNDVYGEEWWTPGAFKVGIGKFQGASLWQNPISGNYKILGPTISGQGINNNEYWISFTGIPGLDLEYNLGAIQVGVEVANQCVPSCNTVEANSIAIGSATAVAGRSETNTQTIVPHFVGTFGSVQVVADYLSASGTIQNNTLNTPLASTPATGTKSASGSGEQVGAKFSGPGGLTVSGDFATFGESKMAALSELKDRTRTSAAAAASIPAGPGAASLHYFTLSDNSYTSNTYTTNQATLRYSLPVSYGMIMPEYVATTLGGAVTPSSGTKKADAQVSMFRVMFQGYF
jgi:hypothetical protein